MTNLAGRRQVGLLIPLFSCPSTASWGIGDIGDIAPMTSWLEGAGQRVLQLLPLNEMAASQQSPYSALSAMAIDPIFIRVPAVPEFAALGGEASLDAGDRASQGGEGRIGAGAALSRFPPQSRCKVVGGRSRYGGR